MSGATDCSDAYLAMKLKFRPLDSGGIGEFYNLAYFPVRDRDSTALQQLLLLQFQLSNSARDMFDVFRRRTGIGLGSHLAPCLLNSIR